MPLQRADLMRALAHPTRLALVEVLSLHDSLTATQASELIDVTPTNCAFHLRVMGRHGLVQEVGRGPGRQRPWRLVETALGFSDIQADDETSFAARALSDVLISHWLERIRRVQADRHLEPPEWQHVFGGSQSIVFGTLTEVEEMIADIRAVLSPIRRASARTGSSSLSRSHRGVAALRPAKRHRAETDVTPLWKRSRISATDADGIAHRPRQGAARTDRNRHRVCGIPPLPIVDAKARWLPGWSPGISRSSLVCAHRGARSVLHAVRGHGRLASCRRRGTARRAAVGRPDRVGMAATLGDDQDSRRELMWNDRARA